jgi:hypothetical protein
VFTPPTPVVFLPPALFPSRSFVSKQHLLFPLSPFQSFLYLFVRSLISLHVTVGGKRNLFCRRIQSLQ